jgi:hypothetical protein
MPDVRQTPLALAAFAALSVGIALAACDPNGGGASLTTPGIVTDAPTGGGGGTGGAGGAADTTVRISPALDTVRVGDTARFVAVVADSFRGQTQQGQPPVHWSVGDTALATIDPTGLLTARRVGTTTVTAAVGDSSRASATVVIVDTAGTTSTVTLDRRRR